MDNKFKGRIINALRKLSYYYPVRNEAKRRQKVAPSTYQCQACNILVYEGKSDKIVAELIQQFDTEVIKGRTNMDHIIPVVPIAGFGHNRDWDWNLYIMNAFCDIEGFQVLCETCHKEKTKYENELRKMYRDSKKKDI